MTEDFQNDQASDAENEFARMLDESQSQNEIETAEPKAGDKIDGTIVQIGEDDAFVNYGGRSELPISTAELKQEDGTLSHDVGDKIGGYVTGKGKEMRLTLKTKVQGRDTTVIEEAFSSGMPLTGTVKDTNKGGFVVDIGGHRAFCPISQIDDSFVEDPATWVGKQLEFRVSEFADGGRRFVVSRRALLREEKDQLGAKTRKTLAFGDIRDGKVARLMPFGAFVDIGGVEGLVHISEISHERIDHPSDVLKEGQEVQVKVVDIQNLGQGKSERISLSLRALASDPWETAGEKLKPGDTISGVISGLAPFGAFVDLIPGIRGMIHISALSEERINHPSDVVEEGQEVTVRIDEIDVSRKRISLSMG
jgi:small subunit ribosomal protein S1